MQRNASSLEGWRVEFGVRASQGHEERAKGPALDLKHQLPNPRKGEF